MGAAKTNGLNGHTNGSTKSPKSNGHAAGPITKRSSKVRAGPGLFARLFSMVARLLTWYSIITVLFRCPSTLEECNETTPQICKPYFQAKQVISPHLSPYYDTYAAPYVDLAKPYYETVDRVVITPGRSYAVKYAGPRVSQAQAYGKAQWEKSVQPQIAKYQDLAKGHYAQTLAPHVDSASKAIAPYYSIAKTNALQTYHEIIFPAYVAVAPYGIQGYNAAHDFTVKTAIPSGLWAWNMTNKFLDTTVWPHVRDMYAVKVEPQLIRIGERLGRYSEKKAKPAFATEEAVDSTTSSFARPSASVSSAASVVSESVASVASKVVSEVKSLTATEEPKATIADAYESAESDIIPENDESPREAAARIVQEDLELWEGKFSKVAEEGASEIEDRIEEVTARMIEEDLYPIGRNTIVKLYNVILAEMATLHNGIRESLQANVGNMEQLDEDVRGLLRKSGLPIKNAAQECRDWRQQFDQNLENEVTAVAQEHFEILEQTRDLAIQKIGMKWAWMDGITYKDWQKYHELKDKFREWINDLKRLIVTHPALVDAQKQSASIDEEAMGIAEHAVKELMKLKEIARYKAIAGDFSDNFVEEQMKLAAHDAEKRRAEEEEAARVKAAEAEEAALAEAARAAQGDSEESQSIAEDVIDTETSAVPPLDSLTEEPTESATDLASDATNEAEPFETLAGEEPVLADGPEQIAEEIVEESEQPVPPPVATPEVKSAWLGAAAQAVPSRQPIIDEEYLESAESIASVVKSDVPASITSAAQAAYTAAIAQAANQYSKAMSVVSVQISGEPKPLQEQMYSSVSDAYFAALASANAGLNSALTAASEGVYGTPTTRWMPAMPTVPSVDWERVQSIAQQNLDDSLGWANKQYEAAKAAASEQVEAAKIAVGAAEPSPSTYLEAAQKRAQKIQEQAQHNYYAGLGVAYARYSEFLSAASTAVSSLTATPTPTNVQGSASSVASVASASAASAASVASASAASAASVASGAAASVASDAGQMAAQAGETVGETWESLVSAVSSQIYGAPTPTPWYENLYATAGDYAAAAGAYAAAATDAAGQQYSQVAEVVGDYASSAGDYAASATSAADSQYSAVSSLVSELIVGKEPTFTESVYSRLAGAYDFGMASASSLASVAAETIVNAASEVTEGASSVISVVEETVASATEKVKETVESIRDEL
ncbi:uncharacterized protein B0I36DRAFT_236619 [Microdochium trichocladiopsis]|uniref:Transcription factor hoxa13 n=1 Tax=Microdochium trichocladiopsis TaxID=1682393 RepID=A0A9P8YHZ7_9PEZI|nr:uncharacterized protein B0I36DRAFT_236619 [Microdochium trichocladiopsis]KAH7038304.1 hypothetical protein B0I36DRAFT_236619 [Microdochium trichocladiopsis]